MLDAFDAMLYALVLAHIMSDLGMTKATSGFLATLTLLASGIGGVLFGFIADRIGRKRALMLSILTYSLCSFASGLATSILMLAIFRFILGLGMGGEWNTGATLVAETWPAELRAKAISVVQSSWAIGYALAALVAGIVLHYANWRMVFFVGILPALLTLWIQSRVPESEMWREHHRLAQDSKRVAEAQAAYDHSSFARLFQPPYARYTFALLLANFFGMFAWWGLFTWLPPYLSLPVSQGGRGFSGMGTTTLLVALNLFGMFPGYALFGWVADHLGRRRAFPSLHLQRSRSRPVLCLGAPTLADPRPRVRHCFLWHGILLGFGHHRQRNLPHPPACSRSRLHLQRRPHHELDRSLHHWTRWSGQRPKLGLLPLRRRILPLHAHCHAITRDPRKSARITQGQTPRLPDRARLDCNSFVILSAVRRQPNEVESLP
jgi:MFS family permease